MTNAWHGLGVKLEGALTAEEAIKTAGLDWSVSKEPLYLADGRNVKGQFATVREDTKEVLGVVGEVYRPLQNKEAFSFFDAVVGEKSAIYHSAGMFKGGKRTWILAVLPGQIRVIGDDVVDKYLLLSNTHDGTGSVTMGFTPIRVVCENTLNLAIRTGLRKQTAKHTPTMGLRVTDIATGLGIVHKKYEIFENSAKALTGFQVNNATWKTYLQSLDIFPKEEGDIPTRTQNIIEEVSALFEHGKGNDLPGVKGSAWAAFNAITEYVDHARPTRGNDAEARRAESLLFGSGALLKQRAWDKALELIA